jgi:F0F1-type ATP synthase epsilon subunit
LKLTQTFAVTIYSPFHTYFKGQALALSAENSSGAFDILARHEDFLSVLSPCTVVVQTPEGRQEFPLQRGILQVNDSTVWLFANV